MPVTVKSSRFGPLEVPEEAVIEFPAGLIGLVLGGLVAATAEGGVGSGNGLGGAFVALVLGLVATVLGGLALARVRRTG